MEENAKREENYTRQNYNISIILKLFCSLSSNSGWEKYSFIKLMNLLIDQILLGLPFFQLQ
jgi:hypothetical protein